MKRALLLACLLCWAATAKAQFEWDDLWHTPDQRGEALLRQGRPADAARLFRDPRRKAYAELQAGNYSQAARDFAAFDDSDGQYDRGNALARAGDLQGALKAYDAALARDPNNRDARHNRDLVARALQKQPPPQSSSGNGKQGNNNPSGEKQNNDQQGKGGANDKPQPNARNGKQKKANTGKQGNPAQNDSGKQGAQPPNGKTQAGQAGQTNTEGQPPDTAEQARADTEAALSRTPQQPATAAVNTPPSETQLAQEQWLRRIPDDPGGLLRRKFMIEHMIRQQGQQP